MNIAAVITNGNMSHGQTHQTAAVSSRQMWDQKNLLLPPENVHLGWIGLYPELSWTPPKTFHDHCFYYIMATVIKEGDPTPRIYPQLLSPWQGDQSLNGGILNISIQTVCNGIKSEPVFVTLNDPGLNLSCEIRSLTLTHCSWGEPHPSADIRFFYKVYENGNENDVPLRECPLYTGRGCNLQMSSRQEIKVLLNGTANNRTILNTYHFLSPKIKLSPLNWTVKESQEQFNISWSPPEFSNLTWRYFINYIACAKNETLEVDSGLSTVLKNRMPKCSYRISLRAQTVLGTAETEWTLDKHYDAIAGPDLMMLAVILIPLLIAVLVLLCLIWCMKNKKNMFPKVPQPNPELFKDILNNNNKISIPNFYLTKAEEECQVTLAVDPRLIRPQR